MEQYVSIYRLYNKVEVSMTTVFQRHKVVYT